MKSIVAYVSSVTAALIPFGVAAQNFPLNVREPAPIGEGYADGKPYDVLGLTTGMDGAQAAALVGKFYTQQGRKARVTSASLPFNSQKFTSWVGPDDQWSSGKPEDTLFVAMSSAASKNQVIYIKRFVTYPKDKPANYNETLAALKAKYGQPGSLSVNDYSATLTYPVRAGAVVQTSGNDAPACVFARTAAQSHPNADRSGRPGYAEAARLGVTDKCSTLMFIKLDFASVNGQRNQSVIEEMNITVVDIDRVWTALEWDKKEIARLKELARTSAPAGTSAPPKL